ncbi:MAG: ABC transporter substrate-binding protein [Bacteroidetes bacterium]|nr:ABC transporter substrate-binding protein [Bacteroidota bacterium]
MVKLFKIKILSLLFIVNLFTQCKEIANTKADSKKVFNYNESAVVTSLDPAAASSFENIWPVNQLFNGLVQMDDSLNVLPSIAQKFSVSNDGLVYTFNLRTDVYFHDNKCFNKGMGRKVVAKDFVYSFNRLFDSKVSNAISLLNYIDRSVKTSYKGFEATNDSTFVIYLSEPFSAFLNILTMKYFSVIPFEAIEMYGSNFRKNPVGTGPFYFNVWDEGSKLILIKNPNYFEKDEKGGRLPYLDALTVSFIKDRETAFMELLNGHFDMLSGADALNINEVLDKEGNLKDVYSKKFNLQKQTFLKTDYIGILIDENIPSVKQSPLKLKAIRKAINYGFDRVKLIKFLRNNVGEPAISGFVPKGMKSYNPEKVKGYTFNPEKAKMLLDEAGFPNGKGLPAITLYTAETYKEQVEFIQSQLQKININLNVSIEKASVLSQGVNRCEYNMFKKSWVADYADEENFMSIFYGNNFTPNGFNYFHYKNVEFDNLYEKSLRETDRSKKIELVQKMENLIIEDAPVIPLYYDEVIRLVSKNVSGLPINPMNLLNLKKVKK